MFILLLFWLITIYNLLFNTQNIKGKEIISVSPAERALCYDRLS